MENLTLYIATTVAALVVGAVFTALAGVSERLAAPRRAKVEAERTALDRAIIEADRRIDLADITQIEAFITSFVAAHLDKIVKAAPVIGPMATAADYVTDAIEAFRRRNPQLADRVRMSPTTMQEKLAGAIGQAAKPTIVQTDEWRAPRVEI